MSSKKYGTRSGLAQGAGHEIGRDEIEIGIVAALFHDIGKARTFNVAQRQTELGRLVRHGDLTLETCAGALGHLEHTWPQAAWLLRHIWTQQSSRDGLGAAAHPLVDMVASADRLSAAACSRRQAFADAPADWTYAYHGGRLHWRMRDAPGGNG